MIASHRLAGALCRRVGVYPGRGVEQQYPQAGDGQADKGDRGEPDQEGLDERMRLRCDVVAQGGDPGGEGGRVPPAKRPVSAEVTFREPALLGVDRGLRGAATEKERCCVPAPLHPR